MTSLVIIFLSVLVFILVMTIVLCFVPKDRIPIIERFLVKVLPRIPFTGIIEAWKKKR
jgi:hypothetical protein